MSHTTKTIRYLDANPSTTSRMGRSLKLLKGFVLALFLFLPLLIINVLQMLSLILRPFSARLFRLFNWLCADRYWAYLAYMIEHVNRLKVTILGDDLPAKENALVIANHQQMSDIPSLMFLASRKRRLGDMKWFVKDVIKYVPGPGWGMLFLDCVFLKRNWMDDQRKIEATFHQIKEHKIPIWLISFLEGTRITPGKLKRSQEFASSRGLQQTQFVMLPRTKGFVATIQGLGDYLDAVYSITIGYPEGIPTLWQMVLGDVKRVIIHVERTPADQLPQNPKELEQWAINAYYRKDEQLARMLKPSSRN